MVKYGALYVCDRCGKEKFSEQDMRKLKYDTEYEEHDGKWLCPTCTELYNKMMNNFFAPEVKRTINLED